MIDECQTDKNGQQIPECACINCGKNLDAATAALDYPKSQRPGPGDVSLCVHCGEVMVFTPDMKLRPAELNDLLKLSKAEQMALERGQQLARELRARREN